MRRTAFLLAALLGGGSPNPAGAAEQMQMSRPPAMRPLPVQEHVLANGLKVLLLERRTAPVVSVQVWYRVGSRNEPVGKSGISHLLEHLMFQGSKKFPADSYKELVERNGGSNNAFTTEDYTAYYVNFPSDRLDLALQLEADRMAHALIPDSKFASELDVVKEERRLRTENDPYGMMWEMLGATAYAAHPYRWPVVGWMTDLDRLTRSDAVAYYQSHYVPPNAVVVVVGDFESARAIESIREHFGPIPGGRSSVATTTQEPPQTGERRTEVVRDVDTPAVLVAYHIGPRAGADYYPLAVLDGILSSGRSSRLYHDLVYSRKLAQQVGTIAGENKDPGLFLAYAVPMPGHSAAELERELLAALDRVKSEDVTDRELRKAINQAEASYIFGQQRNHRLGVALGTAEALGNWGMVNDHVARIRAVTKADIRRVAAATFTRRNRSVVTLVPAKEAKE